MRNVIKRTPFSKIMNALIKDLSSKMYKYEENYINVLRVVLFNSSTNLQ